MMILIIVLHVIVCFLLILIILVQSGRGGGLIENFSGIESMFGTKTNTFLTRLTTILAITFFVTCLSLALLSAKQSKSLMRNVKGTSLPEAATNATGSANATQEINTTAQAALPVTVIPEAPVTQQ